MANGDDAFDFDLFVIGGGSGGVRAARIAGGYGAKVAVAEEDRFGGTCVIRGCVPKKFLVYASQFGEHAEDAEGFGWSFGERRFDWAALIAAKDQEIARLEGEFRKGLEGVNATIFESRATVTGPHTVRIAATGAEVSAKHILVAVGGAPFIPPFPGSEHAVTSNEMFHLSALPRRILVAGGGYIACEFAGIMAGLGVETTQIYRGGEILNGFDEDVRAHVRAAMEAKGVRFIFNDVLERLDTSEAGFAATLKKSGAVVETDLVMFATGRRPNTAGLGLETAGVTLSEAGAIPVNAYSQTVTPSVFAVGDVTNRVNLTPVAIREGHAFADTVFGGKDRTADHALIPTAVFTQPEVGVVGRTEAQARALLGDDGVEIYRSAFRPMVHTLSGRDEKMLMKLVVAKEARTVLGAHIVGHGAAEMIQCLGVAVKMGATKEDFDATVAVHPTAAEELVTLRAPVA